MGAPTVHDGRSYFIDSYKKFDEKFERAVVFSNATGKLYVKQRFGWASYLHLKMRAIGFIIVKVCEINSIDNEIFSLDHSSICALRRNLFEVSIIFSYLSQHDITDEQWILRRNVIWPHDAVSRYKMFKGWRRNDEAEEFRRHFTDLRSKVFSSKIFANLDEERRKKILSGSEIYVNDLRGAVKNARRDKDDFEAMYNYLSQHSHSAPLSFLRTQEHEVDYEKPGEAQVGISALAVEVARASFYMCSRRVVEIYGDKIPAHDFKDFEPDTEFPLVPLPEENSAN